MANRHAHKKLRAEIRGRMASTGETHQQARARILARTSTIFGPATDLVPITYFGVPATLATIELQGRAFAFLFPSPRLRASGHPYPFPTNGLLVWRRPTGIQ